MRRAGILFIVLGVILAFGSIAHAVATDVIEYPTPNFVDPTNWAAGYYYWDNDWGWTHNAIGGSITSASLNIGAYDVDWDWLGDPEVDLIYAKDDGIWKQLGSLTGQNNTWTYTTFNMGSEFFNDINNGLEVWMDIDSTHDYDVWAVALSKSALSIDGGSLPNPDPTAVPEPATMLLIGFGLAGVAALRKRK
jgi:hypothetical protein